MDNQRKHISDLLTRQEAADYLGVTYDTLAVWACRKRYKLPYIKIGSCVRYRRTDLEAFVTANRVEESGNV